MGMWSCRKVRMGNVVLQKGKNGNEVMQKGENRECGPAGRGEWGM